MKSYMKLHCCSYWFGDTDYLDMGEFALLAGQPMNNLLWESMRQSDPESYASLASKAAGVLDYE